jgi:hypothetical protein
MVVAAAALALLLWLVPPAVLVIVRARRERSLVATLFDVPLAVAADLLALMLLSRAEGSEVNFP